MSSCSGHPSTGSSFRRTFSLIQVVISKQYCLWMPSSINSRLHYTLKWNHRGHFLECMCANPSSVFDDQHCDWVHQVWVVCLFHHISWTKLYCTCLDKDQCELQIRRNLPYLQFPRGMICFSLNCIQSPSSHQIRCPQSRMRRIDRNLRQRSNQSIWKAAEYRQSFEREYLHLDEQCCHPCL